MSLSFPETGDPDTVVGQTPWSARVPLDPLLAREIRFIPTQQADVGVGCVLGGPPHQECRLSSFGKTKWHSIRGIVSISRQINFEELPERACHNFVFSSFCLSYVYLPPQPPSRGQAAR